MKICCRCKKEKPLSEFNRKSSNKDGLERYCKECHREKNRNHYVANKETYKESARKFKHQKREWYQELKQTLKCESCGEDKHWRLSFHHKDDNKEDSVSQMVIKNRSKEIILEEIEKCQVLCHNCHSDVHYYERLNGRRSG